ncbi:PilZ domain-containing protein [Candidatus Pacearchaeota archaeon]|nr:PilZ domain-containing protein [Candidatus Pacearchaeota archaeon]
MRDWERHKTSTEAAIYIDKRTILGVIRDFSGGGVWFQPRCEYDDGVYHTNRSYNYVGEPILLIINNNRLKSCIVREEYHKNYKHHGFGIKFASPLYT